MWFLVSLERSAVVGLMSIESSDAFGSPSVLREVLVSLALVLTECLAAFDLQYLEYSDVFAI